MRHSFAHTSGISAIIAAMLFAFLVATAAAAAPVVGTTSLPQGQVGVGYSQTLVASGGTAPYTWSVIAGTLPAGLALNGATIAGTPATAGTSMFTVRATDSASATGSQALSITISGAGTLAVTTASLASGQAGVAYAQPLIADGGTVPYTWSVIAGGLPGGLTLNALTGQISGTPATAGGSSFTVQVADSASHIATRALTIAVPASGAAGGPDRNGLCNAYFRGSAQGMEQRRDATAFQRLAEAAALAGMSLDVFCDQAIMPGHGRFHEKPVYSASRLAQAVFTGGSESEFEGALAAEGAMGAWAQDARGVFVVYIVNGGFVNGPFKTALPGGFGGAAAVILVGK